MCLNKCVPDPLVFFYHLMQMSLSLLAWCCAALAALPLALVKAAWLGKCLPIKEAVRLA